MRLIGALLWLSVCTANLTPPPQELDERNFVAGQLWEKGQAAMREGNPNAAIRLYQESVAKDPRMVCNHLSLATAYLEKKDFANACTHLAKYVEARPEQLVIRSRYADLLLRLHRSTEARAEFERLVADVQERGEGGGDHLVRIHGRLMELAELEQDEYAEHLHRGIGLFLLARKRSALGDPDGELPPEGLLCKAAAELTRARLARPTEARPCWYLFEVWSGLGQRQPAVCQLREAQAAAHFSYLTPAEERSLHLAFGRYQGESQRK